MTDVLTTRFGSEVQPIKVERDDRGFRWVTVLCANGEKREWSEDEFRAPGGAIEIDKILKRYE